MTKGWGETSGCATLWGCSMVHRGKNIVNGSKKSPNSPCNVRAVPALYAHCAQTSSGRGLQALFRTVLVVHTHLFPIAGSRVRRGEGGQLPLQGRRGGGVVTASLDLPSSTRPLDRLCSRVCNGALQDHKGDGGGSLPVGDVSETSHRRCLVNRKG